MAKTPKTAKSMAAALTKAAQKAIASVQKQKTTKAKKQDLPDLFPTAKKQYDTPKAMAKSPRKPAGQGKSLQKAMAKAVSDTIARQSEAAHPLRKTTMPLSGSYRVSSSFGVDRVTHRHSGIDLAVAEGTKVSAVKAGTVSFAGWGNGYGYRVVIDHPDGTQTTYNHLSDIGVKVGENVLAGHAIALSGNTGNSTGPHLHFEVKKDGRYVDPAEYFDFGSEAQSQAGDYTSQMASLSNGSETYRSSSTTSATSRQTSTNSAKKPKKSALPKMDFSAPKSASMPRIPQAQPPTITAYRTNYRGTPNYFDSKSNPLASLVPQYHLKSFRD